MHYFANNGKLFLKKLLPEEQALDREAEERRSAAVRSAGNELRAGNQAELLRTLQAQGVEIGKATAPFTVAVKRKAGSESSRPAATASPAASPTPLPKTEDRTFPAAVTSSAWTNLTAASRTLLDYQYWAPNDPQQDIYDDTHGPWAKPANVEVVRGRHRRC